MSVSSSFTLGNAIRITLFIGLLAVIGVIMQSCQEPKTGIDRFSQDSLKKLTVLTEAPPQPALSFKDADGQEMRLSDYKGKVVLLNVWATWCPPCIAEMPTLDRLQAKRGGEGFAVVTISLDRTALEAKAFLDEAGLSNLSPWHDETYRLNGAAKLPGLPTSILYDRSGREIARLSGEAVWDSPEALALVDYLISQ